MAMNRKEKDELESLRSALAISRAVIFRTDPLPKRMGPHTGDYRTVTVGWHQNTYSQRVEQGCFSSIGHSRNSTVKTDCQGTGEFYATREEALIVMREEMALDYAVKLAKVDAEIEAERRKGT